MSSYIKDRPKRLYRAPLEQRLLSKLQRAPSGCLEFVGGWRDERGYGRIKVNGVMRKPHRIAYQLWIGPIPSGHHVCHRCDNPSCCEPGHLFAGTHQANMDDMLAKGRGNLAGIRSAVANAKRGIALQHRAQAHRALSAIKVGKPPDWKHCYRCGEFKSPADFGPNRRRSDGLQTYCRPCHRQYRDERRTGG